MAGALGDHIGADDQNDAEYEEQNESNQQVFCGRLVVLIMIHHLFPLPLYIKYYIVPNLRQNYHRV